MDTPLMSSIANEPPPRPRPGDRARELYKYFQPFDFRRELSRKRPTSKDTTLTAFAQLVTWRLNARRCTISYFDKNTQYNVAESTKTLNLQEGFGADEPDDNLWQGCASFSQKDSICLHTLRAGSSLPDGAADFEVTNLTEDDRFSWLPFVTGDPHIMYYYGTTFATKEGVNIGTICVLDDKARSPMAEEDKLFIHTIARNVMSHLELLRERTESRRAMKMNQCLTLFINPDSVVVEKRRRRSNHFDETGSSSSRMSSISSMRRHANFGQSSKGRRTTTQVHFQDEESIVAVEPSEDTTKGSSRTSKHKPAEDSCLRIFRKAANLLRSSLDLEEGGGVLFLDTTNAGQTPHGSSPHDVRRSNSSGTGHRRGSHNFQRSAELLASSTDEDSIRGRTTLAQDSCSDHEEEEIINLEESNHQEEGDKHAEPFTPMSVDILATLIERYPQGKLWVFDSDGKAFSDSEEGDETLAETRRQIEHALLLEHFPGAYQILIIPLWDPRSSRWCVCFAYSTSKFRTFTFETDFLYCVAFCNCVTIEMARLATLAADRLKGDFISSISHELRSPLHGILASCEFLQETEASSFQQSLVHTVGSCARTLLDTISMILDYTKINAFERDWRSAAKARRGANHALSGDQSAEGAVISNGQQTMNIYGNVDLAAVTEEVVEGVTAGQQHHDILVVDFGDAGSKSEREASKGHVEVILDIEPHTWTYVTQPGAFRRVVMNLVGNALKYTAHGWIKIHLTLRKADNTGTAALSGQPTEHEAATDTIVLTVSDSGKGISAEYLRNKLYTAFAQEDHLASGTGLGLSLVKSIVRMLNGEIEINSRVGVGTSCVVTIPMIPQLSSGLNSTSSNTTPSTGSSDTDRAREDSIATLNGLGKNKVFALFAPPQAAVMVNGLDISRAVHHELERYLVQWAQLKLVEWTPKTEADVIIVDEKNLRSLLDSTRSSVDRTILVFCHYTSRPGLIKSYALTGHIEFVSKPYGPYKLARALSVCLERTVAAYKQDLETILEPNDPSPSLIENAILYSHGVQVNVIEAGGIIGKDDSRNAHLAMEDPDRSSAGSANSSPPPKDDKEFPFIQTSIAEIASPPIPIRPALRDRRTMSPTASEMSGLADRLGSLLSPMTEAGATVASPVRDNKASRATQRSPRLLLVDDNAINLRLLQTFMKKRKYTSVSNAMNGLEAVEAFAAAAALNEPSDIIFMDISMPVMNGFEATRQIRALEEGRAAELSNVAERSPSALIIALTGLASGKDQSEAFLAGVDLYMTKPTSFKEVGRLLDNWHLNGGGQMKRGVPHGAVTEAMRAAAVNGEEQSKEVDVS